ncbi:MAG: hypothetical protein CFH34_01558 [Alphaproteobacteria bacterium MarineAlpha9_Bin4]|nr:hypothetical protein [Pelagibacterales bacterium]PPR25170.1 MAG: hypothetical protein CFH34_01558 [Alphaproteobacteria bacterium MarineAlpha9_Bin4]
MLIIFYSFLLSYMLFFSICVAPVINSTLDKKNSSILLRKIFPKNFLFGMTFSFFAILVSIYYENLLSILISSIIFIFFILNLYILVPKINLEADKTTNIKGYNKRFKFLHLFSVILYLIQILLCIIYIILDYY